MRRVWESDIDQGADVDTIRAAIEHCWPALEIVDLAPRTGEPDSIVVNNVFHRAAAFGGRPIPLACAALVTTYVNGHGADREPWPFDLLDRIASAAAILAAINERISAGDGVITGSISQFPLAAGDGVRAEFGCYASASISASAVTKPS